MPRRQARLPVCLAVLGCLLLTAVAQGQVMTLPMPPAAGAAPVRTNGLTVHVDLANCVGHGYIPIKITVHAAGPASAPRPLTVRFGTGLGRDGLPQFETTQELEIPRGASSASAIVRVLDFIGSEMHFDLWDRGEHLPDLSDIVSGPFSTLLYAPPILFVRSDGVKEPVGQFWGQFWGHTLVIERGKDQQRYSPSDLPESMIDYSPWGVVLISFDELAHVASHRPAAWSALRRWIVSGGNLMVYDMADVVGKLPRLNRLLELRGHEPADFGDDGKPVEPVWTLPPFNIEDVLDTATVTDNFPSGLPDVEKAMEKQRSAIRKRLAGTPFRSHALSLGTVVALDTPEPLDEPLAYWEALSQFRGGTGGWEQRPGVSFYEDNSRFWDFLIPGVGLAPIGVFEGLIALFVIGVGPMNYFLLWRRHKQSLLLITVPASAILATGGLLVYAVCADGFTVRARTRSFTEIDQRHGEAICWSRIGYYAGRQPERGLEFSLDTEVYPVDWRPRPERGRATRVRQVSTGAERRFGQGWLPVRTQTQLLTIRGRSTQARLEVSGHAAGQNLRVVNKLGTSIQRLLVVDANGEQGWGEAIGEGQSAPLDKIELAVAYARLLKQHASQRLEVPELAILRGYGPLNVQRHARSTLSYSAIGTMLELGLELASAADRLPPRSYVAIVECSPEFELGLPQAEVAASYHVIIGHW